MNKIIKTIPAERKDKNIQEIIPRETNLQDYLNTKINKEKNKFPITNNINNILNQYISHDQIINAVAHLRNNIKTHML